MDRGTLQAMLAEACGKQDGTTYRFDKSRGAAALITTGGELITIEQISEVQLHDAFAVISTERERTFVGVPSFIAIRVGDQADKTGFLPARDNDR